MFKSFQKDPALSAPRIALLPAVVPLQMWINRRIGGEVEIAKDVQVEGKQVVRLRGAADTEAGGGESKEAEDFLMGYARTQIDILYYNIELEYAS